MIETIPARIDNNDSELIIEWKDGKLCHYNLLMLRKNCPCAQCRGGHGAVVKRTTDNIKEISMLLWRRVGRYAVAITWSDGHDLGIYTYDELRASCDENRSYDEK